MLDRQEVERRLGECWEYPTSLREALQTAQALYAERDELAAERRVLKRALEKAAITMNHARTFITSRQKMHATGVALYDELLSALQALREGGENG